MDAAQPRNAIPLTAPSTISLLESHSCSTREWLQVERGSCTGMGGPGAHPISNDHEWTEGNITARAEIGIRVQDGRLLQENDGKHLRIKRITGIPCSPQGAG